MHLIHVGQAPQYLSDCVSTVSAASSRNRLRSTCSAVYILPRTRNKFGERGFFYWSSCLEHSSIWPSQHYWHEYIQKTTQECTFWSCLPLLHSWSCRITAPYKFCVELVKFELGLTAQGGWFGLRLNSALSLHSSDELGELLQQLRHDNYCYYDRFTGLCLGLPRWAGTRRNIHPLTPIVIINHPLSAMVTEP